MYSSGWHGKQMGPVASGLLELRGEETLRLLKELGVSPSPGNRLEAAVRLTRELNEGRIALTADDSDLLTRALEAFRTIWESFLIVHTLLSRRKPHLFPSEHLKYLVRGPELSTGERDPKPRSQQLEMVITAKLILGGADVRVEEPDLVFLYHGDYLGTAIKRVTKARVETIEGALRDAVRQLKLYGKPGFAAVSLDPWFDDIPTTAPAEEFGEEFNARTEEAHRLLVDRAGKDSEFLLGAMIFGHGSRWVLEEGSMPRLEWVEASQFLRFSEAPTEVTKANEFFGPLGERLWNGLSDAMSLLVRPGSEP